jgi:hypothetical protein
MAIFNSYVKLPEGNKIEKKGVDEKTINFSGMIIWPSGKRLRFANWKMAIE